MKSSISREEMPAPASSRAVPPVETISTPSSPSPRAKSTIPAFSETDSSALRRRTSPGAERSIPSVATGPRLAFGEHAQSLSLERRRARTGALPVAAARARADAARAAPRRARARPAARRRAAGSPGRCRRRRRRSAPSRRTPCTPYASACSIARTPGKGRQQRGVHVDHGAREALAGRTRRAAPCSRRARPAARRARASQSASARVARLAIGVTPRGANTARRHAALATPARSAGAPATFEATATICASRPCTVSSSACRFVPAPDTSTAIGSCSATRAHDSCEQPHRGSAPHLLQLMHGVESSSSCKWRTTNHAHRHSHHPDHRRRPRLRPALTARRQRSCTGPTTIATTTPRARARSPSANPRAGRALPARRAGRAPGGEVRPARQALTSGRIWSSSSEYLPAAPSLPASGYSPLKQASQWVARSPRTAS